MSLFKDELRPLIEKEWADFVTLERPTAEEKAQPIPAVGIAFRNQCAKRMLSEEPSEVRAEVEEYRQGLREDPFEAESLLEVDEDGKEAKRIAQARSYHG